MDNDAYIKNNKAEEGGKLGVYRHPESGQTLPADSFAQADAYLRQGWVYDSPLPSRVEVHERNQKALKQQIADAKSSEGNVTLDTINSQLAAARAEEKENGGPVRPELQASDKTTEITESPNADQATPSLPTEERKGYQKKVADKESK